MRELLADPEMRKRKLTAMLVVTVVAAFSSYSHIEQLALRHHQTLAQARLLPVSIDGLVAACGFTLAAAARTRADADWLARCGLVLAVGATVAANVADGWPYGWLAGVESGWPGLAFVVAAEVLIRDSRKAKRAANKRATAAAELAEPAARGRHSDRAAKPAAKSTAPARRAAAAAILKEQPGITSPELAPMIGASDRTARRELRKLRAAELAELATPNGHA